MLFILYYWKIVDGRDSRQVPIITIVGNVYQLTFQDGKYATSQLSGIF